MIYDAAIIGTGPAGLSAALNLKLHQKKFVWFGSPMGSEKVLRAESVQNYPGLSAVTGRALQEAFAQQIFDMELTITDCMINSIMPMGDHYALLAASDFYEAKTLILATGVATTSAIVGEETFLGRGVSYCATCDGNLYKGKTIAVLCYSKRFEHEVAYLASLASHVHFFPYYKSPNEMGEHVETHLSRVAEIAGDRRAERLMLGNGKALPVDGVFCLRDSISLTSLLPTLETVDGHIKTDRRMATNLSGCFAAGDCTGRPYQYAKAVGEGNVAAHSAIEYLADAMQA